MNDEPNKAPTDFQKLTLLLAEKRTAHTTLRSGIALCAFSMTVISFILLKGSKISSNLEGVIFTILGSGSIIMLIFGIYFIRRGFTRMQFHDTLINQILYTNQEASALFYHTRKRNNVHPNRTGMHHEVVFHFDKGNIELDMAIRNIENYFGELSNQKFTVYFVVTGPGIKLLVKENPHAQRLTELTNLGLQIKVCRNAMRDFQIEPDRVLPTVKIISSGLLEIIDLQHKGYAYIKL
ncbi:DsrE family protein [Halodesulfovibrio aestuarii]|uniref:DsrE family protein n=1 Tax=Halodesulfovibrio aestuarii TaxID=126333 RepID=A0A8G2FBH7_9BACT|nr:DsrE family protein [Halodesulfovibrio aestuarii]SHJ28595.1 Intracellular sulfur oxidation protein, DsrE/DsrF family [Halodesulfovibrio aestuarii]